MPKQKKQLGLVCKTCGAGLVGLAGQIKGKLYCLKHYRELAKPIKRSKNKKDLTCHIIDGKVIYK